MKNEKNNITELVFIIDRSGSMAGFEKDTVGGFNSILKEQKEKDGKVYTAADNKLTLDIKRRLILSAE